MEFIIDQETRAKIMQTRAAMRACIEHMDQINTEYRSIIAQLKTDHDIVGDIFIPESADKICIE